MKQKILKYGISAGLAVVGYSSLFYFIDKTLFLGAVAKFSTLLVYAAFMYKAVKDYPIDDFKKILRGAFGVFLIGIASYYLFDFILFNYIDKGLIDIEKELAIEMYRPKTPINEIYQMEQDIRNARGHTVSSNLLQMARWAILGFGLSLIISLFAKRRF
jgi:hypothetical protein